MISMEGFENSYPKHSHTCVLEETKRFKTASNNIKHYLLEFKSEIGDYLPSTGIRKQYASNSSSASKSYSKLLPRCYISWAAFAIQSHCAELNENRTANIVFIRQITTIKRNAKIKWEHGRSACQGEAGRKSSNVGYPETTSEQKIKMGYAVKTTIFQGNGLQDVLSITAS